MAAGENNMFGGLFKKLRIASGKSLRVFCKENGFDAGNISKIERGRLGPPENQERLKEYAIALGVEIGSEQYQEFCDVAAASHGRIPADLLTDEALALKLPAVFRTLRGAQADGNVLDELAEKIRET